jgi:MFS family permease
MLSSAVALGSVIGALISARRSRTRLRGLVAIGAVLCAVTVVAATVPGQWFYALILVGLGTASLMFLTAANSSVQLAADDSIRGRVMGIYLLVFIGSGAFGGPLLGAIDEHLGPRLGMLLSGLVPAVATIAVACKLAHDAQLRVQVRLSGSRSGHLALVPR